MSNSIYCYLNESQMSDKEKEITNYIENEFGIDVYDCPRVRSWEISLDEPRLEIRGRFGGGNREEYEDEIDNFERKYNAADCYDDDTDCTYGYFEIKLDESKWIKAKELFEEKDKKE